MAAKRKPKLAAKRERDQALSEADIISAALRLIRSHGVEALGMRGLAHELGVSPMAIYYYVPNKDELLARVAESLSERVPLPPASPEHWAEQLRSFAMSSWELFSEYPGLSAAVMEHPPMRAARKHTAHVLALFRAAGFDARAAFRCLMTFHTFLAGVLAVQAKVPPQPRNARAKQKEPGASEAQQVAFYVEQLNTPEWMSFSLDTLITGFRARAAQHAEESANKKRRG